MKGKNISVRKNGLVLNVKVSEFHNDNNKLFEGEARVNNEKELERLLSDLDAKGFLPRNKLAPKMPKWL